jgi:beta-phosphoglucomutase-like phosphatase (HAD superfamily)
MDQLFSVRVDGATLAEENIRGKPAPDSFLTAAEQLGATPQRSVVVEDAISGVEAGRAGHFGLVIGVDREGHGDALRQHGADIVVTDLGELAT